MRVHPWCTETVRPDCSANASERGYSVPVGEIILLPAVDGRNPVSHFVGCGMQRHCQLGLTRLCEGSHLRYETHCGDCDLVGRKLQALRVAQDADRPSDSLKVVQRLPHALQLMNKVMDPLSHSPDSLKRIFRRCLGAGVIMVWIVTLSAYVPKSQSDTVIDEYKHKGKGYMIGATCVHSVLTMKTMFVMGAICWLGSSAPEAT